MHDLSQEDYSTYVPFALGVTVSSGVTDFNKASNIVLQLPSHPEYLRGVNLSELTNKDYEEFETRLQKQLDEDLNGTTELGLRLRDLVAVTQEAKEMHTEHSKVLDEMFEHVGRQQEKINSVLMSRKELADKLDITSSQRSRN